MNIKRRAQMLKLIKSQPMITFAELTEQFPDVSSMTLRRDISYFEKQGEVIKVRGGARSMSFIKNSLEDSFEKREAENTGVKKNLCLKALEYIESSRSVFLDSGTTMLMFAGYLPDERMTVTTTAPNVAMKLLNHVNININIVGGILNRDNISISGTQAVEYLTGINIDTAFLVPSGFSVKSGFTGGNYNECEVKKHIIKAARRKVILLDNNKIDRDLPYTFADVEDADVIISDIFLPHETIARVEKANIKIFNVNS